MKNLASLEDSAKGKRKVPQVRSKEEPRAKKAEKKDDDPGADGDVVDDDSV